SRRRHTRFSRDWSSDVCSSDLAYHASETAFANASPNSQVGRIAAYREAALETVAAGEAAADAAAALEEATAALSASEQALADLRSEERRVGKECTSLRAQRSSR